MYAPPLFRSCCLATEARREVSGHKVKQNHANPQRKCREMCIGEQRWSDSNSKIIPNVYHIAYLNATSRQSINSQKESIPLISKNSATQD
mgnify:CR=1 FL=1